MLSRTLCAVGNEEHPVMANTLMHANLGMMFLATSFIEGCGSIEASVLACLVNCGDMCVVANPVVDGHAYRSGVLVGRWPTQASACMERIFPKRRVVDDRWSLGGCDAGPPCVALTCVGACAAVGFHWRRPFGMRLSLLLLESVPIRHVCGVGANFARSIQWVQAQSSCAGTAPPASRRPSLSRKLHRRRWRTAKAAERAPKPIDSSAALDRRCCRRQPTLLENPNQVREAGSLIGVHAATHF